MKSLDKEKLSETFKPLFKENYRMMELMIPDDETILTTAIDAKLFEQWFNNLALFALFLNELLSNKGNKVYPLSNIKTLNGGHLSENKLPKIHISYLSNGDVKKLAAVYDCLFEVFASARQWKFFEDNNNNVYCLHTYEASTNAMLCVDLGSAWNKSLR